MGIMSELFGSSSDDEAVSEADLDSALDVMFASQVPGLSLVRGFLDEELQAYFKRHLEQEVGEANQSMRFGDLAPWAQQLCGLVRAAAQRHGLLPAELLSRDPLFNQFIINVYRPGDGTKAHVDLMRFEDGICSISFGDAAIMTFSHDTDSQRSHQVLLRGGDLLMMHGEARYQWRHGIAGVKDEWYQGQMPPWEGGLDEAGGHGCGSCGAGDRGEAEGQGSLASCAVSGGADGAAVVPEKAAGEGLRILRGTRVSVTFRRMCSDIVLVEM